MAITTENTGALVAPSAKLTSFPSKRHVMMGLMGFREMGIEPADGFTADGFIVRPLVPTDVALDYDAVMSSREFLYHWEQDPPYPPEDFSIEDNLADLELMDKAHREGSRYTYTVLNRDETEALGCIYLLPSDDRLYRTAKVTSHDGTDLSSIDVTVSFWVRTSTWDSGFERDVLGAVLGWLREDWALEQSAVITNEKLAHQMATIESLGLTRRFDYDRDKDMYTSHVYASHLVSHRTADTSGPLARVR